MQHCNFELISELSFNIVSNLSEIVKYVYYVYFTSQPLEQTDKTIILKFF